MNCSLRSVRELRNVLSTMLDKRNWIICITIYFYYSNKSIQLLGIVNKTGYTKCAGGIIAPTQSMHCCVSLQYCVMRPPHATFLRPRANVTILLFQLPAAVKFLAGYGAAVDFAPTNM